VLWQQSRLGRIRDIAISAAIGGAVGLFALAAVTSRPKPESIATWHLENTLTEVSFSDVVGAIVTDFRGLDTIIEITVFSVAALGVLTLISKPVTEARWPFRKLHAMMRWNVIERSLSTDKTLHLPHTNLTLDDNESSNVDLFTSRFSTPLTRVMAQWVLPFAFLVALVQLLYGGDGPGDGFTAGVISGLGIALWYIVFGYHEARRRLQWLHERRLIGVGLALVVVNALVPMLIGEPFLAHLNFDQIVLPANLHLSSTLIYETGIFLTILGSVSTIMEAIAYPKEVEPL
jgi:multicomponent K+:H+ antiporter subunit A